MLSLFENVEVFVDLTSANFNASISINDLSYSYDEFRALEEIVRNSETCSEFRGD